MTDLYNVEFQISSTGQWLELSGKRPKKTAEKVIANFRAAAPEYNYRITKAT